MNDERAKSGQKPKRRAPLPVGWRASSAVRKVEATASDVGIEAAKLSGELCAKKSAALLAVAEARAKLAGLPPDQQRTLSDRLDATERRLQDLPVCPPSGKKSE